MLLVWSQFPIVTCWLFHLPNDFLIILPRLRDELKAQSAELVGLQSRLKDAQVSISEFHSNMLPKQYELTKTLHEKELLAEQVRSLEEELQKKTRDDRAFRSESINATHELEVALKQAKTEAEDAVRQAASLKVHTSLRHTERGIL
jgi:dsDNA-specific endonuclease/ATPase MutS2